MKREQVVAAMQKLRFCGWSIKVVLEAVSPEFAYLAFDRVDLLMAGEALVSLDLINPPTLDPEHRWCPHDPQAELQEDWSASPTAMTKADARWYYGLDVLLEGFERVLQDPREVRYVGLWRREWVES